jgi:mRNA interferase RelE/StbE
MASFRIEFKPSVQKDFRAIPKDIASKIWEAIESLVNDPLPKGVIKLSSSEGLYRKRVGDYRIIYSIDYTIHEIEIKYVRHRSQSYRNL